MLNLYFLKFIKDVCTSDKEMFFADFEERTRGSSDYLMRGMLGVLLYPKRKRVAGEEMRGFG
jgi:hypothetical protein